MKEKYKNKYRIKSHRKPGWDYSDDGIYFLTIVTQNRICNLGKIVNNKMILSDFGKIVKNEFEKSFEIRDELFLNEYIIMPNHIHMIIVLNKIDDMVGRDDTVGRGYTVEPHGRVALRITTNTTNIKPNRPIRQPKSISSFFAGYKSAVNSKIDDYIDENNLDIPKYNKNNHFFQPNYHDHIIRNDNEHKIITAYIKNNPQKWNNDTFNE
ncbi:MAG: hypothetical protein B7C24_05445 [Bacteroidetes bacterium 4572_77]|nr:MAG: hypothetical protein B7C24_05445 [Bacteroidetes bacterium 4572_77]